MGEQIILSEEIGNFLRQIDRETKVLGHIGTSSGNGGRATGNSCHKAARVV